MHRRLGLAVLALGLAGCASTTTIRSNPPGAKVLSTNGYVLGRTPYEYEDTQTYGHVEKFRLEMDGYESGELRITRQNWNPGRVIAFGVPGLFVWPFLVGLAWAQDYDPEYTIELQPEQGATRPPGI